MRATLEDAIERPVKEAVREALAEGVHESAGESDTGDEPVTVDVSGSADADGTGSTSTDDDTTSAEGASRSLPRRLLGSRRAVVLGAIVAATYLRRRRSNADAE